MRRRPFRMRYSGFGARGKGTYVVRATDPRTGERVTIGAPRGRGRAEDLASRVRLEVLESGGAWPDELGIARWENVRVEKADTRLAGGLGASDDRCKLQWFRRTASGGWAKKPTKWMIDAYEAGRRTSHLTYQDIFYNNMVPDDVVTDHESNVFFEAGRRGLEFPKFVCGWRYGDIPECGRSYNHREGEYEAGLSIMGIEGEGEVKTISRFGIEHRPVVRVCGWLHPYEEGGDGEPLLILPKRIEDEGYGGLGAIPTDDLFSEAIRSFPPTDDPTCAGYILPDGTWLDMCGAGGRFPKHNMIQWAYPPEERKALKRKAVADFLQRGAVRVHRDYTSPETVIEFSQDPTPEQARSLRDYLRFFEAVWVERVDANRDVLAGDSWGTGAKRYHPDAVVNWMRGRSEGMAGLGSSTKFTWTPVTRSPRKGKKYKVRVCTKGKKPKCRTIHFGASGYRISPGTEKGDNYCARSSGIKGADDPMSANYWSRRMWGCEGKKSKKTKALRKPR